MSEPGYHSLRTPNPPTVPEQTSPLLMAEGTASSAVTVSLTSSGGFSRSLTSVNQGVGKSTLLRHIAMREVPIPPHITILFVEQEVGLIVPSPTVCSHDLPDRWR